VGIRCFSIVVSGERNAERAADRRGRPCNVVDILRLD